MLKKAALAGFALVLVMNFSAPRAQAQVHVGVGVSVGAPVAYGAVAIQPAPVVVQPAPIVVQPAAVVVYDDVFFVAHSWDFGFHEGFYYDHGCRYWVDRHGHRHYDNRYRDARVSWEHRHNRHDNGWHRGEERGRGHGHEDRWQADRGHDNGWRGGGGHGHGHDRD